MPASHRRSVSVAPLVAAFAAFVLTLCALPTAAAAFCGFYVSGAEAELYNNATVVTLMRDGKRTVMAMQNNYEGPAEDFALVIPVPEVLKKKQVKTLEDKVFERLDRLTAPRLVEYWQKDPCTRPPRRKMKTGAVPSSPGPVVGGSANEARAQVKIEAQFDVGEYNIVVLSADESNALETWLNENDYNIPDGAAEYFRPYIEKGQYFFVAKVDIEKATYEDGQAVLSPLRFYYDSDNFKLPVRLGLINAKGKQDLFAMVLANGQRYKVSNYPNVTIPTNIGVTDAVREEFGGFYEALFRRVQKENPKAVVTEYSWNAASCDPCPSQPLTRSELMTLGADVLANAEETKEKTGTRPGRRPRIGSPFGNRGNWVVTRLHARYSKDDLGEDLVFEKAEPITGGRGMPTGKQGKMRQREPRESSMNTFQARYIIRHPWEGDVDCDNPHWNRWGGPPAGGDEKTSAAGNLAFGASAKQATLTNFVADKSVPGLATLEMADDGSKAPEAKTESPEPKSGNAQKQSDEPKDESGAGKQQPKQNCRGCSSTGDAPAGIALFGALFALALRRRFR